MLGVVIAWVFIGLMFFLLNVIIKDQLDSKETRKQIKIISVIGWIMVGIVLILSLVGGN